MLPTAEELAGVLAPFERARPLPPRVYTDPAVLAWELEHVFGRLALAHSGELREPGAFVVREVGRESLLAVRGADGVARAFFNVCQHRGARLVGEPCGSARRFTCPYHSWTYGLDGALVHAGWMDRPDDVRLTALRCDEEGGLLWADLNGSAPGRRRPGSEPVGERLAVPLRYARRYGLERLVRVHRIAYDVAANWKVVGENYSECYHCPGVHPELHALSPAFDGGAIDGDDGYGEHWCGGYLRLADGVETMACGGSAAGRAPLPGVSEDDRRRVNYFLLFPNCLLALHPDYALVFLLWPRAVDRTEVVCDWLFAPEEAERPGFEPSAAIAFWDQVNREDWAVCARTQLGLGSRGFAGGRYAPQERDAHAFARIVARAYAAR